MSLVEKREVYPAHALFDDLPGDPFRLGWRGVPRTLPDGEVVFDVVPLQLEDLLFPEEYDHPMTRPGHSTDCMYLYACFQALLAGEPQSLILTDCRVDFGAPDVKPLGPDVAVFLNAPPDFGGATFHVAARAARPILVVEVTSPETFNNDLDAKLDLYHRANVPCYVIIDSEYDGEIRFDVHLLGYRHAAAGYEPIPFDEQGRLWVEPLACWLTIENDQVVCIEGATGRPIEPFLGQLQARQVAEARTEAEVAARVDAEARTQAEVAARVDAEARTAAEVAARVDAEARTAAEVAARLDAEARTQAEARRGKRPTLAPRPRRRRGKRPKRAPRPRWRRGSMPKLAPRPRWRRGLPLKLKWPPCRRNCGDCAARVDLGLLSQCPCDAGEITWRCWSEAGVDGPTTRAWGVSQFPMVYVLDASGVIRFKNVDEADLDKAVDALLTEPKPAG